MAETLGRVLLLNASFSRFRGELSYCRSAVARVERLFSDHAVSGNTASRGAFDLAFERGLCALLEGDFRGALDDFYLAKSTSEACRFDDGKLLCEVNILLCLESLGLPRAGTLRSLEQASLPASAREQLEAYRLREAFRSGDIRAVSASRATSGQSAYFRVWVSALPYLPGDRSSEVQTDPERTSSPRLLHNRDFRRRTIDGVLHPDDFFSSKPSDWVDRLYLWTWRWLVQPDHLPLEKLLQIIGRFPIWENLDRLTSEDRVLLRNALQWLSLFDERNTKAAGTRLNLLPGPNGADFPLLEFESLVTQYLHTLRNGPDIALGDLRRLLEDHPLWSSPDVRLADIVLGLDPNPGPGGAWQGHLARSLAETLAPRGISSTPAGGGATSLLVDCRSDQLLIPSADGVREGRIVSAPMTRAFALLHRRGTVTLEEFARECFGITRFDPIDHQARIFNLLARMRPLSPGLRIGVKSGFVVSQGDWRNVRIVEPPASHRDLSSRAEWLAFLGTGPERPAADSNRNPWKRDSSPRRTRDEPAGRQSFAIPASGNIRRSDLERALKRPRSTTNRIIARWVSERLLIREGRSRGTSYRLTPELRRRLAMKEIPV